MGLRFRLQLLCFGVSRISFANRRLGDCSHSGAVDHSIGSDALPLLREQVDRLSAALSSAEASLTAATTREVR